MDVLGHVGYAWNKSDSPVSLIRWIWKHHSVAAENRNTLMMNLWTLQGRKCGNPKDKIYALLGVCKDVRMGNIAIDHSFSVARVYYEAAKFIFRKEQSLKLLSACQSYGSSGELPSWAPDWSMDARYRPLKLILDWEAGDEDEEVRRTFNAARSRPARLNISNDMCAMTTQGLVCATVILLGVEMRNESELADDQESYEDMSFSLHQWWLLAKEYLTERTKQGEPRTDAFWRTVLANMGPSRRKATAEHEGKLFWDCIDKRKYQSFPAQDWQAWLDLPANLPQAISNRRFFVTLEGYMGLGPRDIKPHDVVCILLGSLVPLALRETRDGYVLLGECYLHGVMEGEATREEDGRDALVRDFVIK